MFSCEILQNTSGDCFWELVYMITENFLIKVRFYGVVGITHGGAYFRCFIAFEKLQYQARFKVYLLKLKTKTKNFDYFSKTSFQTLVNF